MSIKIPASLLAISTAFMRNPRCPRISTEELQKELQDLQDSIKDLPAKEADRQLHAYQQVTLDRLRNQLCAPRNKETKPLDNCTRRQIQPSGITRCPAQSGQRAEKEESDLDNNDGKYERKHCAKVKWRLLLAELGGKLKTERKSVKKSS